jgi:ABC-type transport system substrate-binding protein
MLRARAWRHLLLLTRAALCLAGCLPAARVTALRTPTTGPTPTVAATGRRAGDTLTILYWQAPTVLNPHLAQGAKDRPDSRIAYEPLASFDRDGNLIPFPFEGSFAVMLSALRGYATTRNRIHRQEFEVNRAANDISWDELWRERGGLPADEQKLLDQVWESR